MPATFDLILKNGKCFIDGQLKIIGRKSEVISVGGLKIVPSEVERVALKNNEIKNAKAYGRNNPVTGQHVEIICEPKKNLVNNQQLMEILKKDFKKEIKEEKQAAENSAKEI